MVSEFIETFSRFANSMFLFVELNFDLLKIICTTESINVEELIETFFY